MPDAALPPVAPSQPFEISRFTYTRAKPSGFFNVKRTFGGDQMDNVISNMDFLHCFDHIFVFTIKTVRVP